MTEEPRIPGKLFDLLMDREAFTNQNRTEVEARVHQALRASRSVKQGRGVTVYLPRLAGDTAAVEELAGYCDGLADLITGGIMSIREAGIHPREIRKATQILREVC
ncbi:hypothetical protein [Actinomadura atramentaria]|uniref:hypothetical protein n=1 Tax=Actinomadura atramentaria TaxID=1990 RepID=UPI0003719C03|nr:hypothetical protein [Actinomadura atramentaria]